MRFKFLLFKILVPWFHKPSYISTSRSLEFWSQRYLVKKISEVKVHLYTALCFHQAYVQGIWFFTWVAPAMNCLMGWTTQLWEPTFLFALSFNILSGIFHNLCGHSMDHDCYICSLCYNFNLGRLAKFCSIAFKSTLFVVCKANIMGYIDGALKTTSGLIHYFLFTLYTASTITAVPRRRSLIVALPWSLIPWVVPFVGAESKCWLKVRERTIVFIFFIKLWFSCMHVFFNNHSFCRFGG